MGGGAGGVGDDIIGEFYDDSAFDEQVIVTFDDAQSIKATVAVGERHDGTEGTGCRFVRTAGSSVWRWATNGPATLEWLEFDQNGNHTGTNTHNDAAVCVNNQSANFGPTYNYLIIHGAGGSTFNGRGRAFTNKFNCEPYIINSCVVYDMQVTGGGSAARSGAVWQDGASGSGRVQNCTFHDITSGTGNSDGILYLNNGFFLVKNTVVTGCDGLSFNAPGGTTNLTSATNADDDGNMPSPIGANPVVPAVEYVSATATYDLHLKAGAECIDAGTTLSGEAGKDIDGETRSAPWDVGGDEFQAAVAGVSNVLRGPMAGPFYGRVG
jgi:hypothetical protein